MTCVVVDDFEAVADRYMKRTTFDELMESMKQTVAEERWPFEFPFSLAFGLRGGPISFTATFLGMTDGFVCGTLINAKGLVNEFKFSTEQIGLSNNQIPQSNMEDLLHGIWIILDYINNFDTYYERVGRAERKRIASGSKGGIKHTDTIVRLMTSGKTPSQERGEATRTVRYHLCRGHYKNHMGQRRIWIKPHWKGNKELGTVHKEYKI